MTGPGICVLCLADTCTSEVHPVFNPVAPYGYLLSDMYLFMVDITYPDFLVYSCRTWIGLDITRFCEKQRQPSSGSAWPACPKNGKPGTHCWGRGGSTQFAQRLESAVTTPPLVVCVVWNRVLWFGCFIRSGSLSLFSCELDITHEVVAYIPTNLIIHASYRSMNCPSEQLVVFFLENGKDAASTSTSTREWSVRSHLR